MIELTTRTSGASETTSYTSTAPASSSSSACDARARGAALVDDRLGKRALPGPPARVVQLVFGKEVRRREQVCDELRDGIDPRGKGRPRGRAFAAVLTGRAEIRGLFGVHIPRMRYRP